MEVCFSFARFVPGCDRGFFATVAFVVAGVATETEDFFPFFTSFAPSLAETAAFAARLSAAVSFLETFPAATPTADLPFFEVPVPSDAAVCFFALAAIAERGTSSIAPRPISELTLFVFCVFLSVFPVAFGFGPTKLPGDAMTKSVAASGFATPVARGLSTNRTRGGAGAFSPEPAIGGTSFTVDTRFRVSIG